MKVDNTRSARPQVGLSAADLVVEELVEGGLTRLAVFYQSRWPGLVGPVRSLRTSDIGIVASTGGVVVASGASRVTFAAFAEAGLRRLTPPAAGFFRADAGRHAPYNLLVRPARLRLPALAPPTDYLPWAEVTGAGGRSGGPAPKSVAVRFSASSTTRWSRDADGRWRRVAEFARAGDGFAADNLLILSVRTRNAGYRDPAGNPVPETILTGGGPAVLLTGKRSVAGRWEKASPAAPIRLRASSGEDLHVPAGRTWIELVPPAGSVKILPRAAAGN